MLDKNSPFEIDFDSYIRQSEPEKQENGRLWQTAIGLQKVDGLSTSAYLYETAKRNIAGEITIEEAKGLIDSYYETRRGRAENGADTEEADKVSVRIREILAEKTFSFTPDLLLSIHRRLFDGVFYEVKAGQFRDYNISKREWVVDGASVLYANADMIQQTLEYDFEQEKSFDYSALSKEDAVKHLARFVANIWQIHPFGEGNTRTTAVFAIKYLQSLGFDVSNEPFEKNSWYFRNALVRANYTNMSAGIYMNTECLEKFCRNLLLGEQNALRNRHCHIRARNLPVNDRNLPANLSVNKTKKAVLELLLENNRYTYDELAAKIGRSRETVRANLRSLEKKNLIAREGADKSGFWIVKT